ncbi:UNC-like C-terminal-domain-containing protein [Obelidium mucronatum]|nr:UNC-like C-terminal-domain-containing protein [Obelidium mucronatum]
MRLPFLVFATALLSAARGQPPALNQGVDVDSVEFSQLTTSASAPASVVLASSTIAASHYTRVEAANSVSTDTILLPTPSLAPKQDSYLLESDNEETIEQSIVDKANPAPSATTVSSKLHVAVDHLDLDAPIESTATSSIPLPFAAETIVRDILAAIVDISSLIVDDEPALVDKVPKLDLPPLVMKDDSVSSTESVKPIPTSKDASIDSTSKESVVSHSTTTSSLSQTSESQPTVSATPNSTIAFSNDGQGDDDDGADVTVLANIMARAVENAMEEAVSVVDTEDRDFKSSSGTVSVSDVSLSATVSSSISETSPPITTTTTTTTTTSNTSITASTDKVSDTVSVDIQPPVGSVHTTSKTAANTTTTSQTYETSFETQESRDQAGTCQTSSTPTPTAATTTAITTTTTTTTSSSSPSSSTTSISATNTSSTSPSTTTHTIKWSDPVPKPTKPKAPKPPSTSIHQKPKPKPSTLAKRQKKEERFNHASFDCGALILGSNPGASSATSILVKSKDQYMLNKCKTVEKGAGATASSGSNFVIVELCDTIKIDTLMLANFEYFSGTFKEFNVYIAEQYPPKPADSPAAAAGGRDGGVVGNSGWLTLGNFVAANVRDSQYFKVKDPLIFTRYLKIEFVSYHGSEYYCPMTQLKVFGKTEMEEFREEEESIAAALAKEEEAIQEAIRNVAVRAVKEIDFVACVGDGCSPGSVGDEAVIPGSISYEEHNSGPRTNNMSRPSSTSTQKPTVSQTSTDSAPNEEPTSSYVFSADYFRLFMESQDQTSPASLDPHGKDEGTTSTQSAEHIPATSSASTTASSGSQPINQESIFKTISKRLALLERNSTLSYKFIEEQSRAYHAAFIRVETARADAIKRTLGECNKTMTRVVRELAKDYEASWSLLLRDLERQRRVSETRVRDIERNLEKLSDRMTRQIFYEFVMVILLVLLLTRIFSPTPLPSLSGFDTLSPLNSPHNFRKHFSPYFSRYIPASAGLGASGISDAAPNVDINAAFGVQSSDQISLASSSVTPTITSATVRKPSNLQHFSTLGQHPEEEEDVYFHLHEDAAEDEVLSSPDAAYYDEEGQYRFGDESSDVTESEPGSAIVPNGPMEFSPENLMVQRNISPKRSNLPERKSSLNLKKRVAAGAGGVVLPPATTTVPSAGGLKARIRDDFFVRSEPTTPMLSSTNRFVIPGSDTTSAAAGKKKKKRRRSLAGLRLQSQSEFIQSTPPSTSPPPGEK